jgi:protein tyrosine phosphatase (PTP) superfamily phosphohydrolase (DUF442 family)
VDRLLIQLRKHTRDSWLLFCGDGSRAAMLFAIQRALDEAVPVDQALAQARRAGMKPRHPEVFGHSQVLWLTPRA